MLVSFIDKMKPRDCSRSSGLLCGYSSAKHLLREQSFANCDYNFKAAAILPHHQHQSTSFSRLMLERTIKLIVPLLLIPKVAMILLYDTPDALAAMMAA